MGVDNLGVVRHVGRLLDDCSFVAPLELVTDGDLLTLIRRMLDLRGRDTVRHTESTVARPGNCLTFVTLGHGYNVVRVLIHDHQPPVSCSMDVSHVALTDEHYFSEAFSVCQDTGRYTFTSGDTWQLSPHSSWPIIISCTTLTCKRLRAVIPHEACLTSGSSKCSSKESPCGVNLGFICCSWVV